MHSVVTSAIGSIATEIFARGSGGKVGISSSILSGLFDERCLFRWSLIRAMYERTNLFPQKLTAGEEGE